MFIVASGRRLMTSVTVTAEVTSMQTPVTRLLVTHGDVDSR